MLLIIPTGEGGTDRFYPSVEIDDYIIPFIYIKCISILDEYSTKH